MRYRAERQTGKAWEVVYESNDYSAADRAGWVLLEQGANHVRLVDTRIDPARHEPVVWEVHR